MERIHIKGFRVSDQANGNLEDQLRGIAKSEYEGLELFEGVAATTDITLNYFEHSERALKQLADGFNQQKGVYTDHNTEYRNRIGKTLRATISDGVLTVIFGLKPNLDVSNSNDIIEILRSTGGDLSASYYPEEVECNICQEELIPYWGGLMWECCNNHRAGYLTDEGNRTTGKILSLTDVVELSLVSVGANLNAEVTKELQEKVGDDVEFLKFMSDSNRLNYNDVLLKFGLEDKDIVPPVDQPKPEGEPTMDIKDFANIDTALIDGADRDDLVEIIKLASQKVKELNDTVSEMKTADEYESLAKDNKSLKDELDETKPLVEQHTKLKTALEAEVKYWQDTCIAKKQTIRSYSDDDPRLLSYSEEVRKITDINELRNKTSEHTNTQNALKDVSTILDITPPADQPSVKSGLL